MVPNSVPVVSPPFISIRLRSCSSRLQFTAVLTKREGVMGPGGDAGLEGRDGGGGTNACGCRRRHGGDGKSDISTLGVNIPGVGTLRGASTDDLLGESIDPGPDPGGRPRFHSRAFGRGGGRSAANGFKDAVGNINALVAFEIERCLNLVPTVGRFFELGRDSFVDTFADDLKPFISTATLGISLICDVAVPDILSFLRRVRL